MTDSWTTTWSFDGGNFYICGWVKEDGSHGMTIFGIT
jgi:hypothetical protein